MATARNVLKPRMFTIKPSMAGIRRLSSCAQRWGTAFFYTDGLAFSVSNVEIPEAQDLWILTTSGPVTAWEIEQMLIEELS